MAEKLSVQIYNSVKQEIESGTLGARTFISEAQIAQQYGVSKAPVRDALHLLSKQGYLVSYHRKGYMVNSFTVDEINQIQAIRKQLEKLSVELIIDHATDEEIQSLRAYTSAEYLQSGDRPNQQFHMAMARLSGNQYLPGVLDDFLSKITLARGSSELDADKHDHLIDAMLQRDKQKAMQWLDEDIAFLN